ncbi:MAG TPA: phosphoglycerate kinase [Candidatus Polarisedimenticolaceae bacterium]|nr:phosphoglycerate kinase [Candidatus Polarisedimenticolaceae bacterium]
MKKLSVRDLDLRGTRVFCRVDFNVPLENGRVTDDRRIAASLETIRFLAGHGARVVLASHLGRPKGKPKPEFSLRPCAERLERLLGKKVAFASDCIGEPAASSVAALGDGDVVLLENLRFHKEEEANDPVFAQALARLGDLYVDDAFGSAHRAHASTDGVPRILKPAAAGFLMERELDYLGRILGNPESPFVAVLGGAKVSDKIELIENLLPKVDTFLIGGAMAYTFLAARGVPIGQSLLEADKVATATDLLARAARAAFVLPLDHVVAVGGDKARPKVTEDVAIASDEVGFDIGPRTAERFAAELHKAKTVLWNGPMGLFEVEAYAEGTRRVAEAIAASAAVSVVGGGDSAAAVTELGLDGKMTHVSTGGGASLEFLSGLTLPGVAVLDDAR